MDEENVVHLYNGLSFSYKTEWSTDMIYATTWMTNECLKLGEKKPGTKGRILYDSIYIKCWQR